VSCIRVLPSGEIAISTARFMLKASGPCANPSGAAHNISQPIFIS
jgi:hypothetical protein